MWLLIIYNWIKNLGEDCWLNHWWDKKRLKMLKESADETVCKRLKKCLNEVINVTYWENEEKKN